MSKKQKTLEEQLYLIGLVFLVFGSISIFIYMQMILPYISSIPCRFMELLGLYCPGCGGTRAVKELLHGHLLKSLWYHPLVLYTIIVYGGFMLSNTMARFHLFHVKGWKFHAWHLYGALIIVISNFILKNILLLAFNIAL